MILLSSSHFDKKTEMLRVKFDLDMLMSLDGWVLFFSAQPESKNSHAQLSPEHSPALRLVA